MLLDIGRLRDWLFKGTMKRTLPDETYSAIVDRLNEVMGDLIESSEMIDRGDDEFENWCQILISTCVRLHLDEWAIREPRHPKGLIAELRKQHKKLQEVRISLANLPDQYVRATWSDNFNFEPLAEFEDSVVTGFTEPLSSMHNYLSYASVSLAMKIAQAVRESPADRRNSPKTDFSEEMIYLFQKADFENEINTSPTSRFADFFSLSYYVATGEDGVFLEHPVKTAIANIRAADGQIMHPHLYAKYISDEIKKEIEDVWPDRVAEIKRREASNSNEDNDWLLDTFNRDQIQDADWVRKNLPVYAGLDRVILSQLIEAGLRALKNPTDNECKKIAEYDLSRARTSPPAKNG